MHPGICLWDIREIADVKLQSVSFYNHLVARCDIENRWRGIGFEFCTRDGGFVCPYLVYSPRVSYRRNSGFCAIAFKLVPNDAGATPASLGNNLKADDLPENNPTDLTVGVLNFEKWPSAALGSLLGTTDRGAVGALLCKSRAISFRGNNAGLLPAPLAALREPHAGVASGEFGVGSVGSSLCVGAFLILARHVPAPLCQLTPWKPLGSSAWPSPAALAVVALRLALCRRGINGPPHLRLAVEGAKVGPLVPTMEPDACSPLLRGGTPAHAA